MPCKTLSTPKADRPHLARIAQAAEVRYRTAAVNPDGSIHWFRQGKPKRNLILDVGLDEVAARNWCDCFKYAAVGTGTNPTQRDSGTTTFTRSGTTVTASAAFFEAADVGRLLKFDTGEEMYITAFISTTEVTVNISGTLAASEGTVWYVNDTQLQTESKRTNTYRTSSGDNGSTWNAVNAEWTHKRTFLFSTEVGAVTYREVGWSWGANPTNLFGRDVLPGAGDSLVAGQQYLIVVELVLRISPAAITAVGNVGTGWDTSGNAMTENVTLGAALSGIDNLGNTYFTGPLEPNQTGPYKLIAAYTANWTQQTSPATAVFVGPSNVKKNSAGSGYAAGNFFRDYSVTFAVSEANGTIYGLGIADGSNRVYFSVKFTTPQTKLNTHTLAVTFRLSWGRRLTN